ncbi:MAG TPA: FecR family protein [Steroidobacteraceae bacterium]|nr:FecR family protein [Steroidobacteraceae bacterium]
MNADNTRDHATPDSLSERPIATLLKLAGERHQPSPDATERARAAAQLSWERSVEARQQRVRQRWIRSTLFLASLATAAAAVILFVLPHVTSDRPVAIAQIARIEGDVRRTPAHAAPIPSNTITAGETIETADGRIAIAIGSLSLRVDRNTRLVAANAEQVELQYGRVYVDSGGVNAHSELRIVAPGAVIQHRGTQFQVASEQGHTRVLVREGRVHLETAQVHEAIDLTAGDGASVDGSSLSVRHGLSAYSDEWQWASAIAPTFDIEDRPFAEFLTWITREHGWQLRYASADLQRAAQSTRLHGSLLTAKADDQLKDVALMTGMDLRVDEGVLIVSQSEDAQ